MPEVASISPTRCEEMAALLHTLARSENPGATVTMLHTTPYKNANGTVRFGTALAPAP